MYPEVDDRMENAERRRTVDEKYKYKSFVRNSDVVIKYIYFQLV
jgi:hypothetical protein